MKNFISCYTLILFISFNTYATKTDLDKSNTPTIESPLNEKIALCTSTMPNDLIEQFKEIYQKICSIPYETNIISLNEDIFGTGKTIQTLVRFSETLNLNTPDLSFHDIAMHLTEFFYQNMEFFNTYAYEKYLLIDKTPLLLLMKITPDQMKNYLETHFNEMDSKTSTHSNTQVRLSRIIWSRAFSLAMDLYKFNNDFSAIKMLYDAILNAILIDNNILAARINRGVILYVKLLGKIVLNIPIIDQTQDLSSTYLSDVTTYPLPLSPYISEITIPEDYTPINIHLTDKAIELISNEQGYFITQFKEIEQKLRNIPINADVHDLDAYIFGPEKKIETLANIGSAFNLDDPNFSFYELGNQLNDFFLQNKKFADSYEYEKYEKINGKEEQHLIKIPTDTMSFFLYKHFAQMDEEVTTHSNGQIAISRIIWSRAFSLAFNLYKYEHDYNAIKMLYDAAIEGQLSNGGCLAGRINRGFVLYVSLLGKNGLGDIE